MALTQVNGGLIESGAALENIGAGNITPAYLAQPLTRDTAKASTSGTFVDFTGIPSWVKRITVMFSGVSTNGSSNSQVQIGDSGGIETTGYLGASSIITSVVSTGAFTTGFGIYNQGSASTVFNGVLRIENISGNLWVCSGVLSNTDAGRTLTSSGTKTLSDVLTQVRITTVNGTDTFDAGTINILYE